MTDTISAEGTNYAGTTASMLGDPEAHRFGGASVSFVPAARCENSASRLEWVPAREQSVVPDIHRQMCLQCPVRQWCLDMAMHTESIGYWAGTTTAERRVLQQGGGGQRGTG